MLYNEFMSTNRIVIAPSYGRQAVFRDLLGSGNSVHFGVEVLPLKAFMRSLVSWLPDDDFEFTSLLMEIRNTVSSGNIYRDQLAFPSFFRYFYDFVNFMADNDITPDQLPQQDGDRLEIIRRLYEKPLNHKLIRQAFLALPDVSNIEISDYFLRDASEKRDLDLLVRKGARRLPAGRTEKTEVKVRHARNSTREISAIAQHIIRNRLPLDDVVIMVNNRSEYLPVIRQIFALYGIPCQNGGRNICRSGEKMRWLLNYLHRHDLASFRDLCNNNVISSPTRELIEYIDYLGLDLNQLTKPFDRVEKWPESWPIINGERFRLCDDNRYATTLKLELKAREQIAALREALGDLPINGTIQEMISYCYDYLIRTNQPREEIDAVYGLCMNIAPLLDDSETSFLLMDTYLRNLALPPENPENAVLLASPYQSIPDKRLAIVVGCNQQLFPESINLTGFFDEKYLEDNYIPLVERTAFFIDQLSRLYTRFPQVIFSFCTNDLSGNSLDKSTFLNAYEKEEPWPLQENDVHRSPATQLTPDTARKLFGAREDRKKKLGITPQTAAIVASPSSFESYVQCPFKYFLNRGLKVNDNELFTIDSAFMGNVQHHIMEGLFSGNISTANLSIPRLVAPYFASVKQLFINDGELIDLISRRLCDALTEKTGFLLSALNNTAWKPAGCEEKILQVIPQKDHTLVLNGKIDRIDRNGNNYMIVDYKTSHKSISEDELYTGEKIQLMTYLLAYGDNHPDLKAYGVAYYNLKLDNTEYQPDKDPQEIRLARDRYSAYLCDKDAELDKQYYSKGRFNPDLTVYRADLLRIYEILCEKILSGNIAIDPRGAACLFCPYGDICHGSDSEAPAPDRLVEKEVAA